MSDPRDPSPSERMDWLDERPSDRCRCGGDMPGRCPGPAACPMCQPSTESETE